MRKGFWGLTATLLLLWGTTEPKAAPAPAQAAPTIPNLMAHWGFEQAAGGPSTDGSGNGNTGTHVGNPAVGAASSFPGSTQSLTFSQAGTTRVDVADSPSLSLTGSLTLAAWVNVTDAANQHGIIEKHDGGGGFFLRLNANEYVGFTLFGAGGVETGAIGTSPRVIPLGQWVHVAATYNTVGNAMIMYVNGNPDPTTGTASGPPVDGTATLRLGRDYGANGLNGMMDEARIYNRALSKEEIDVLRFGQPPATGMILTPVAGGVQVDWSAPAPAVANVNLTYAVLVGDTASGPWTLDAQNITGTTHIVDGLPSTQPFFFQVIAVSVVASAGTTPASATPLAAGPPPPPHTTDHEEGLLDGKCECGTVRGAGTTALWAGLVLALGAILAARRR